jgi:hypothetical protein
MPKCRNSDTSSTRVPQRNFPPFWSFGLRDFANPDAKLSVLQPMKPPNALIGTNETLIQRSSLDLDPTAVLAPRDFATRDLEHPIFGLSPCEPPSSRDPLISATCPPPMDGCDSLATSPLANLDAKVLNFQLANPRNEIMRVNPTALVGSDPTARFLLSLHLEKHSP